MGEGAGPTPSFLRSAHISFLPPIHTFFLHTLPTLQLSNLLEPDSSLLAALSAGLPPGDVSDDQLREVLRSVFGHQDFRGRQVGDSEGGGRHPVDTMGYVHECMGCVQGKQAADSLAIDWSTKQPGVKVPSHHPPLRTLLLLHPHPHLLPPLLAA